MSQKAAGMMTSRRGRPYLDSAHTTGWQNQPKQDTSAYDSDKLKATETIKPEESIRTSGTLKQQFSRKVGEAQAQYHIMG